MVASRISPVLGLLLTEAGVDADERRGLSSRPAARPDSAARALCEVATTSLRGADSSNKRDRSEIQARFREIVPPSSHWEQICKSLGSGPEQICKSPEQICKSSGLSRSAKARTLPPPY